MFSIIKNKKKMYFPEIIEKSKYSPRREGKKNQVKTFGYFGCVAKLAK
jgi:hypothetical protein